jgi:hypothetical protein
MTHRFQVTQKLPTKRRCSLTKVEEIHTVIRIIAAPERVRTIRELC